MKDRPPNLLLVFGDEMRWHDMGHAGNSEVHTPNIDCLATQGVSFSRAVANCPVCTPSRGTMLTGLHAHKHGALSNDVPIRTDVPTLGTVLRDAGYATGYIGKWHLDGMPRNRFTPPGPRRLGFDHYWAVWNCHHDYFHGKYYEDTPEVHTIRGYEPDTQTEMAIDFMRRHRQDPFALALSWGPPHGPLELVPDRYRLRYEPGELTLRANVMPENIGRWTLACAAKAFRSTSSTDSDSSPDIEHRIRESIADYYAAITALDADLGCLLAALRQLELEDSTVVIFTSDHGSMLWSHGRIRKQQPWMETVLVPFVISAPGQMPAGLRTDKLVGLVDLLPTALELLGQEIPEGIDGKSVCKAVLGEEPGAESAFLGVPVPVDGITQEGVDRGWRGVLTDRFTYACWEDGRGWVLYDNEKDPYQMSNLIDDSEALTLQARMDDVLRRCMEQVGEDFSPWQEYLRRSGVVHEWNMRERMSYVDDGRQVVA